MSPATKNNRQFWFLLALLLVSAAFVNIYARVGEAHVERQVLREFPEQIGTWRQLGGDERFDTATEQVLRADDYLARNYILPGGRAASFYVGYYATQRNGATYHSPLNCLPGSGWTLGEPSTQAINPGDGSPAFTANRYIINKGDQKYLLIYWYQGRGRKVASEYWGKIYTVIDSARRRRSDGAMVRVMVPINRGDEAASLAAATDLAAQVEPQLSRFIPD